MRQFTSLDEAILYSIGTLEQYGETVDAGRWQGVPTEGKPDLLTREVLNIAWTAKMPPTADLAMAYCLPNMPWAEAEFQERMGGVPRNPHNSLQLWPWWNDQIETPFTHTYSERFWPKQAGDDSVERVGGAEMYGIRYRYGDLNDLLELLRKDPYSRQAYLPIFFPEDTGAVHGGRIPCTLGYHLMRRGDDLHLWYDIRSCDAVRHFRDDVYMAVRLCQWVIQEQQLIEDNDWEDVVPGVLSFSAHSFHVHMGDMHLL